VQLGMQDGGDVESETLVDVPFDIAADRTYDSEKAIAIKLDMQGSVLWYFPTFLDTDVHVRLLPELEARLKRCQARPHAFGLKVPDEGMCAQVLSPAQTCTTTV